MIPDTLSYERVRVKEVTEPYTGEMIEYSRSSSSGCTLPFSKGTPTVAMGGKTTSVLTRDNPSRKYALCKRKGLALPNTPFHITKTIADTPLADYPLTVYYDDCKVRYRDPMSVSSPPVQLLNWEDEINKAIGQCGWVTNRAAASSMQAAMDALTFLGEGRESVSMIKGLVSQVFNKSDSLFRELARSRRHIWRSRANNDRTVAFAAAMSDLSDHWLQARYGIRPLINDIDNIIDSLSFNYAERMKGTSSASVKIDKSQSEESSSMSTYGPNVFTSEETVTGTVRVSGCAWSEVRANRPKYELNPIATAWELIPMSFMVDKIVDVGSYIQANTTQGATLVVLSTSIKLEAEARRVCVRKRDGSNGHYSAAGGYTTTSTVAVEEYFRYPSEVALPGIVNKFDTLSYVDLGLIATKKLNVFRKVAMALL